MSPATRRLLEIGALYTVALATTIYVYPLLPGLGAPSGETWAAAQPGTGALAVATTVVTMLGGALVSALPLAWTYRLTRRRRRYSQSMAHALVVLPLAVAVVAMLVPGMLAIGATLAGMVALASLRRPFASVGDPIYLIVAASIGVAAARGQLLVGTIGSLALCVSVLACSWLDVARQPVRGLRRGWQRLTSRRLTKAPVPVALPEPRPVEDRHLATAALAWQRHLAILPPPVEEARGAFNATVRIRAVRGARGQAALERVLHRRTRRWELHDVTPGDDRTATLSYHVRVSRTGRGRLLDALQHAPHVVGVVM